MPSLGASAIALSAWALISAVMHEEATSCTCIGRCPMLFELGKHGLRARSKNPYRKTVRCSHDRRHGSFDACKALDIAPSPVGPHCQGSRDCSMSEIRHQSGGRRGPKSRSGGRSWRRRLRWRRRRLLGLRIRVRRGRSERERLQVGVHRVSVRARNGQAQGEQGGRLAQGLASRAATSTGHAHARRRSLQGRSSRQLALRGEGHM